MNGQNQENTGYSFESTEQFSWNGQQLGEYRYVKIKEGFENLIEHCQNYSKNEDPEDTLLLDTMADMLSTLERTFIHHFQMKTGHIVSPKSDEPWD